MANDYRIKIEALYDLTKADKELRSKLKALEKEYEVGIKAKVDTKLIQQMADKLDIVRNRAEGARKSFQAYTNSLNQSKLKAYASEIDDISNAFKKAQESGKQIDLTTANSQLTKFKGTAKEAGLEVQSIGKVLKNNITKFSEWLVAGNLLMGVWRSFQDGVRFVGELDSALTNINYTMDVSKSDLNNIAESSIKMAKDLKTSASNVLQAVTIYANANETAQSILQKAQPTLLLSNVTGMSASDTADILQGTMEQFSLAEDQLMHISDVFEKVSQSMNVDFSKQFAA